MILYDNLFGISYLYQPNQQHVLYKYQINMGFSHLW